MQAGPRRRHTRLQKEFFALRTVFDLCSQLDHLLAGANKQQNRWSKSQVALLEPQMRPTRAAYVHGGLQTHDFDPQVQSRALVPFLWAKLLSLTRSIKDI